MGVSYLQVPEPLPKYVNYTASLFLGYKKPKTHMQSIIICEGLEYKVSETPRVLFRINCRYRGRIILYALISMFKLFANIIILKNVNNAKYQHHFIELSYWLSHELKLTVAAFPHRSLCTCWHVGTQSDTSPPAISQPYPNPCLCVRLLIFDGKFFFMF